MERPLLVDAVRAVSNMDPSFRLSEHFTLGHMLASDTARARGINNWPGFGNQPLTIEETIQNLLNLCQFTLEPLVDRFQNVHINSGFRCLTLNSAIGSKSTSQHVKGQAADLHVPGVSNYDVACYTRDNLEFDQLILENVEYANPTTGWVHVSYAQNACRKSVMTLSRGASNYQLGLIF